MSKPDIYILERNATETDRLAVQNKVFNKAVGYLLHPSIQRKLPSSPNIAELATGTGAFLVSLADTLPPTAHLDAYDISPDSFLPKDQLPARVTLSIANARQPPQSELEGQYDVVCIRFICGGLMPEDWQSVAHHAWTLLKPGGALQWIEGDLLQTCTVLRSEPETKTEALERATSLAFAKCEHWKWFIPNLCGVLGKVGFESVKQMVSSTDRVADDVVESRRALGMLSVGATCSGLAAQRRRGLDDALGEVELEALREEMIHEVESGAYTRVDMHQFVAWKPA